MKNFYAIYFALFALTNCGLRRWLEGEQQPQPVEQTNEVQVNQPIEVQESTVPRCKRTLLNSYEFWYDSNAPKQKNLICPSVTANCCSYQVQMKMFKNWVKSKDREKIIQTYKDFLKVYDELFNRFKQIQEFSKLHAFVKDDTNCKQYAEAIFQIDLDELKLKFDLAAERAFQFLYLSRKGFYCSICDAHMQQFYQLAAKKFTVGYEFCQKMVQETLPYYKFKYLHWMKLSRSFAKYLRSCDIKGNYHKEKQLKHSMKFFKQYDIYDDIIKCNSNITTEKGLDSCVGYCQRFNPTRYDKYLEGEYNRLVFFEQSLKKRIDQRQNLLDIQNAKKDLDIGNRRILATEDTNKTTTTTTKNEEQQKGSPKDKPSEDKVKQTEAEKEAIMKEELEKEENEFNDFNKKWNYYLIHPFNHEFNKGAYYVKTIKLQESILTLDIKAENDVSEFQTKVDQNGIDFYEVGRASNINLKTASLILAEEQKANESGPIEIQQEKGAEQQQQDIAQEEGAQTKQDGEQPQEGDQNKEQKPAENTETQPQPEVQSEQNPPA